MRSTEEQRALITFQGGNALVDAGPGTGKTTTLIEFILERLQYTPATAINVLMFNGDIQREFVSRIKARGLTDLPSIRTFHSFSMNLLKQSGHLERTGLSLNMDTGPYQLTLARNALKIIADSTRSRKIAAVIRDSKTADTLLSFVGLAKAQMLPVKEVFANAGIASTYSFLIPAYYEFEKARKAENILFFDDWVPESVKLLQKDQELRNYYQTKFSLTLIDEFQDINASQYEMVRLIKGLNANIVVVGDVDQSIYSWRGSNPGFMLTFANDFPPCTNLALSKTFRYGHRLSLLSNHLISNNTERFDSITTSADGTPDTVVKVTPTATPASDIIKSLMEHMEGGGDPSDCAVLIRRWSQAMLFELSFLLRRVPYKMPPEFALPSSKEIKLLSVLLTFVTGSDQFLEPDERATLIYDLLRFPHTYVANTTLMEIARRLSKTETQFWASAVDTIQMANPTSKIKYENVRERLFIVSDLCSMRNQQAIDVYSKYLDETKMDEWLATSSSSTTDLEEAKERIESLATVLRSMKLSCIDALDYFRRLIILSKQQTKTAHGVTLTTIFRAKGCEYPKVMLPYWDSDTMPVKKKSDSGIGVDEAEERRLAYVGMTRAKDNLEIFHCAAAEGEHPLIKASKFIHEAHVTQSLSVGDAMTGKTELPTQQTQITKRYLNILHSTGSVEA